MRRFRFGLRALMLSIAGLAILLGLGTMVWRILRAPYYEDRIREMVSLEAVYAKHATKAKAMAVHFRAMQKSWGTALKSTGPTHWEREASRMDGWAKTYQDAANRYAEAGRRYRYAATRPWVSEPANPARPD